MRARLCLFTILSALVLPWTAFAQVNVPDCVDVGREAPYRGYGYTHIVVVQNQCGAAVRCRVATDVDPAWQSVTVAAGQTERVVTRSGSPASAFQPRAECTQQ